jgi:hypothetical protein
MTLCSVDSTTAHVALHRSARSRVTSFRERERIPGLFGGVCACADSVRCFPLDVVHASPFIVFKGRARVTFVVKR